jgi:ubiquinone/menaquinone biosynthesis C-methylase UbiE
VGVAGASVTDERCFYQQPGLHVEIYDQLTAQGGPGVNGDVEFFTRQARQTGGPIIELGCGTGRVTWALAVAGFETVGLDLSEAMLSRARTKTDAMTPDVRTRARFLRGDMADFQFDMEFNLALIPFRSFQSLTSPRQQRECLLCIHRCLRPDGRLIVDLFDPRLDWCLPDVVRTSTTQNIRHPTTHNLVRIEVVARETDPLRQLLTERWRFTEIDGEDAAVRQEEEVLRLRWTYRQEMRYLFESARYEVLAEFSDYHESPPAYGREQIWVVRRSEGIE